MAVNKELSEWPVRLAALTSILVVYGSAVPWATGLVVLPRGGQSDASVVTAVAGVLAGALLAYRCFRYAARWKLLFVPLVCYTVSAAVGVYAWIWLANVPPDLDEYVWGVWLELRTTSGLWIMTIASFVGIALTAWQIQRDRPTQAFRERFR